MNEESIRRDEDELAKFSPGGLVTTVHNSIDIRLFEGESIINAQGKVIATCEDGKLVKPKEEVYLDTDTMEALRSLVEGSESGC